MSENKVKSTKLHLADALRQQQIATQHLTEAEKVVKEAEKERSVTFHHLQIATQRLTEAEKALQEAEKELQTAGQNPEWRARGEFSQWSFERRD